MELIVIKILDFIAWINNNAVGVISLLGAFWVARKSVGYFERKQVEKEMALVENAYISLMKALDVLKSIKSQSFPMDAPLVESLRENPSGCIWAFEESLKNSYQILEKNRDVFTDLYVHQLKISLFLKDENYNFPLLSTIELYKQTELLLTGLRIFINKLQNPQNQNIQHRLADDSILFASKLWEKIELTEDQKKKLKEGNASKNIYIRVAEGQNSLLIQEIHEKASVYGEWLRKQISKYRNKKSDS